MHLVYVGAGILTLLYYSRKWNKIIKKFDVRWLSTINIFYSISMFIWYYHNTCYRILRLDDHTSILWVFSCLFRLLAWVKSFWQWSHLYGRSPVWTRTWLHRPDDRANDFTQNVHLYFFSLMCTRLWLLRSLRVPKHWPQLSHWCGFFNVCFLLIWSCKSLLVEERCRHSPYVHAIGFKSWKWNKCTQSNWNKSPN